MSVKYKACAGADRIEISQRQSDIRRNRQSLDNLSGLKAICSSITSHGGIMKQSGRAPHKS